jgi:hypothetical protein
MVTAAYSRDQTTARGQRRQWQQLGFRQKLILNFVILLFFIRIWPFSYQIIVKNHNIGPYLALFSLVT